MTGTVDELLAALGPRLMQGDTGPLRHLFEVIGRELDKVADIVRDRPGYPGWSLAGDLDRTPAPAWLLQWVGVDYRPDLTVEQNRARGRLRPESSRGTPQHLIAVAQEYLGGGKRVEVYERWGGISRAVLVRVYAAELVGARSDLLAALLRSKPWTINLTLQVVVGWSYDQARAADATYAAARADFPSYNATTYHQP